MVLSNSIFDDLVGEISNDTITTIFGPPACGKTTLCLQFTNEVLKNKKKVLYIDTEGGFSVERFNQLCEKNSDLEKIFILSPKSFEEQHKTIKDLSKHIKDSKDIGLIIVDSLVMLYRLKLGDAPQKINKELGEQLRTLTEISRNFKIPILVTNQMYKEFDTNKVKMVGGLTIEYWSKTIIEFEINENLKTMILRKHKYKKEGEKKNFEITNSGVVKPKRGFNIF